tara:strand:- start:10355 stop:11719 length:1365 start_codon:yes stop_codon:yes gene_type:complete
MSEKILVPELGESITEATVSKWLKNAGDTVETDEPVVELETDKVNLEVPSPSNGVLGAINVKNGQTVEVGSVLGIITANGQVKETVESINSNDIVKEKEKKNKNHVNEEDEDNKVIELTKHQQKESIKIFDDSNKIDEKKVAKIDESEEETDEDYLLLTNEKEKDNLIDAKPLSPAVRKIVTEKKIDIDDIEGSGKDGRILKGDLLDMMSFQPKPSERKIKFGQEERIKMTRLRQTIAKRLKQAQENAAMLTTFNEVDMSEIIKIRENNQNDFQKRFEIKLGFMSFFVKACVIGLKNFPMINAEVENDEMVYKNYYNISFAVGTEKGLVVPVLRNADELSFAEIEKKIKDLSDKAKKGNLTIEDLQGGTFTISNGGVYGSMLSTPILNPPQSGVLGMHNIVKRPIVVNDEIKIRPVMYLALSYDHRIIDGKDSVTFLKTLKELLEDPRRLFLDI